MQNVTAAPTQIQCRVALRDQNVRHNRTMELGTVIDALYESEINYSRATNNGPFPHSAGRFPGPAA
jgi:hypothetical protein